MAGIVQTSLPSSEPVAVSDALNYCKVFTAVSSPPNAEYNLVASLLKAARKYVEDCTSLFLASRNFCQSLDCFPFYPYSREPYGQLYGIGALALYFGYGPILPIPMPPYGQNYNGHLPFEIVLLGNPVTAVDHIQYIGTDGNVHTMLPGRDFIADMTSFPARVVPMPGSVWPQCTMAANSVQIFFTCGYQAAGSIETVSDTAGTTEGGDTPPTPPDQQTSYTFVTELPETLYVAILMLTMHYYENRGVVAGGSAVEIPHGIQALIDTNKIHDFTLGISSSL